MPELAVRPRISKARRNQLKRAASVVRKIARAQGADDLRSTINLVPRSVVNAAIRRAVETYRDTQRVSRGAQYALRAVISDAFGRLLERTADIKTVSSRKHVTGQEVRVAARMLGMPAPSDLVNTVYAGRVLRHALDAKTPEPEHPRLVGVR